MARTFTLAQIRDRAKSLSDFQSTATLNFISDSEWNTWISNAYTELYDLLCDSGLAYFRSTQTVTSIANQGTYALSSDFMQAVKVEYQIDSQTWDPLSPIDERADHRVVNTASRAFFYQIIGTNLVLLPAPTTSGQTYRLRYVPTAADLTSDGQTVDGVDGWERLIAVDAAIMALQKEKSDTTTLERERQRILQRIQSLAQNRALTGGCAQVYDVYGDAYDVDPSDYKWWR